LGRTAQEAESRHGRGGGGVCFGHRTALIRFPGEGHELSRSGKPSHRVERLQHILNWFDKYLQGADIKLYDPQ
jgi:hypothetical protein